MTLPFEYSGYIIDIEPIGGMSVEVRKSSPNGESYAVVHSEVFGKDAPPGYKLKNSRLSAENKCVIWCNENPNEKA